MKIPTESEEIYLGLTKEWLDQTTTGKNQISIKNIIFYQPSN